jgi:hypothetical protein
VRFERGGEMLRIAAMRHRVISQPRRHFFGVRHSRLARAEEYPDLSSVAFAGPTLPSLVSYWGAFACIPGYQRMKVSRSSSFSTFVRTWIRLCAPDSLYRICCFFTIRLLTT